MTEVGATRALDAGQLVAVGGEIEIQRQDLALGQSMLQPQRDDGFASLCHEFAPAAGAFQPREQQLGHLLGDRRSTFDNAAAANVADGCADQCHRIDSGMRPESAVLCCNCRVDEHRRQPFGRQPFGAVAVAGACLVQHFAGAIEHCRRFTLIRREQVHRKRSDAEPAGPGRDCQGGDPRQPPSCRDHRLTSIVCVAVRPRTSGSYISSTRDGAVTNMPAVVARTTYENSWCPSLKRVANSRTRSSCRST